MHGGQRGDDSAPGSSEAAGADAAAPPPDAAPPKAQHIHFAALPGMWDRTLTISSAGKTFSATGWQVGWVVGPRRLVRDVQTLLPCVCDDDAMTIYDDV